MRLDPLLNTKQDRAYAAYRCDECGVLTLGWTVPYPGNSPATKERLLQSEHVTWLPEVYSGKDFPDVPTHIGEAANEAHTCYSAQAYRAAILMARAVVEATAKDKGVATGTLAAKIDELHAQGHVRELIKDTAHEIRFLGNNMAHGDFVVEVTEDEAVDVLFFMDELLDEVYQAPARVQSRRAARQAAKQNPTP